MHSHRKVQISKAPMHLRAYSAGYQLIHERSKT